MSENGYDLKPAHRRRVMLLAIVLFGVAAMLPRPARSESKDDTTGTVSKAEPALKQDGTPSVRDERPKRQPLAGGGVHAGSVFFLSPRRAAAMCLRSSVRLGHAGQSDEITEQRRSISPD